MQEDLKKIILDSYKNNFDCFYEKACEEVGNWIEDYETHPDTGARLADVGYYSNEEEIEEKTKELFINYFLEDEIPEEYDYLKRDQSLYDEIYKIL